MLIEHIRKAKSVSDTMVFYFGDMLCLVDHDVVDATFFVGGSLYIKYTAIEQLPNNLKVGDTIWAENSKLQKDTITPIGVEGNIEW